MPSPVSGSFTLQVNGVMDNGSAIDIEIEVGATSQAAVPEPGVLMLLTAGMAVVLRRRP